MFSFSGLAPIRCGVCSRFPDWRLFGVGYVLVFRTGAYSVWGMFSFSGLAPIRCVWGMFSFSGLAPIRCWVCSRFPD